METKEHSYKLKISDRGGDMKKSWYLGLTVTTKAGAKFFKQIKENVNRIKTKQGRHSALRRMKKTYSGLLDDGWLPQSILGKMNETKEEEQGIEAEMQSIIQSLTNRRAPSTIANYRIGKKYFTEWAAGVDSLKKLSGVNYEMANSFYRYLLATDLATSSVNKVFSSIRYLIQQKVTAFSAFDLVKREKARPGSGASPFVDDDFKKFVGYFENEYPGMLILFNMIFGCGFRLGDALKAKVGQVDTGRGLIWIDRDDTKGKRAGYLIIPEWFLPDLSCHIKGAAADCYILGGIGKGMGSGKEMKPSTKKRGRSWVSKNMREAKTALGMDHKKYSTHSFRKTSAVRLYEAGLPLSSIQDFLRHKQAATTEVYLKKVGIDSRINTAKKIKPMISNEEE